jgi:tryptophanyl-tRNA synthetase
MSLKNPLKKMSKSELEGCIFLDDAPDAVEAKIKRAVTDSGSTIFYDPEAKPAISNLLDIYAGVSEKPVAEVQAMFENKNYGEFKAALATLIIDTFASFRARKAALIKDRTKLATLLTQGSRKAAKIADQKMLEVRKKLGLVI